MIFPFATSFIAVLALGQTALAALTPAQVVTNINLVATISGSANAALVPLSTSTSFNQVKNTGTALVTNFNLIIQHIKDAVTEMNQTPSFSDADAEIVVVALTNFVTIHQILLGTVIGKHGILAQFGVTAPVAVVLSSLEVIVDSFAGSLIALIPTRQSTVNTGVTQLGGTLTTTISTYRQICIPSPLYPSLGAICIAL